MADDTSFQVSVVVPLHNEEAILMRNADYLAGHFDRIIGAGQWHFVLVDNNSTDRTAAIIEDVIARWPGSLTVHVAEPNYGKALRAGLEAAPAKWAHSIDIEQWDIPFIGWAWRHRGDYDLCIGSKRADPTLNRQAPYRRLLSWGLNALINLTLEYSGAETHGPKLMDMEKMRPIIADCRMSRGQFDVEFVVRAFRKGLRLVEAPVIYVDTRPPRNLMIKKIYWNIREFLRLRRLLENYPYEGPVRLYRVSRLDVLAEEPEPAPL